MTPTEQQPTRVPTSRRPRARTAALAGALSLVMLAGACSGSTSSSTASTNPTGAPAAGPTKAQAALVAARPFRVHVPPGKSPGTAAPLLILLHGYGVTGAIQEAYFQLTPVADARGMLYVHLDGTVNQQGKRFWNATDSCCGGPGSKVDDSAYITAVIADVKANYKVDPRRVFFVGHSNGGFMSYRMACDHSDEIAAIVSVAGATWSDPGKCTPTQGVAILEVHGTADRTIRYEGGSIGALDYPSATTTVQTWARYNGCAMKADTPAPTPHAIVAQLPPATVTSYSSRCKPNGHAELWTQPDGGHIPPFSPTFAGQIVTFLLDHPKR